MQLLSLFALEAIIAISHVYAQEPVAEVWAYSTKACGSDAFSSSFAFTMFETNTVLTGKEWYVPRRCYTKDDRGKLIQHCSGHVYTIRTIFRDSRTVAHTTQSSWTRIQFQRVASWFSMRVPQRAKRSIRAHAKRSML